jgi:hypothetical protein
MEILLYRPPEWLGLQKCTTHLVCLLVFVYLPNMLPRLDSNPNPPAVHLPSTWNNGHESLHPAPLSFVLASDLAYWSGSLGQISGDFPHSHIVICEEKQLFSSPFFLLPCHVGRNLQNTVKWQQWGETPRLAPDLAGNVSSPLSTASAACFVQEPPTGGGAHPGSRSLRSQTDVEFGSILSCR